ncbi:MAG: hypothetical protein J5659_06595 [Clostridia bacterium]|nr:hypothetical protein [Clostridia bacterium]
MQKIFEGKVYDMIKKPDGLVFSYLEDVIDENVLVKFKMLDAKSGIITDIAKNVYLLTKFGSNYKPAVNLCDNFITVKAINLPSGKLFLCEKSGNCYLLDSDGSVLWNGIIIYHEDPPSDIALYDNCVWASFDKSNVLIRFNIVSMREELRIGGEKSPFCRPKGLFIEGNTAIVSNVGSKSLTKVNLSTYAVSEYYEFTQSVKSYIKVGVYEFVLLENGIFSF